MKKIRQIAIVPEGSIIKRKLNGRIDYLDIFCLSFKNSRKYSVDELSGRVFSRPDGWIKALFDLRNLMVKPFGLATGSELGPKKDLEATPLSIGEQFGVFTVIDRTESEIVVAGDDKHLYGRLSVLLESNPADNFNQLYLTTLVQFHNLGGKLYFAVIKPFHKLVVKALLARVEEA